MAEISGGAGVPGSNAEGDIVDVLRNDHADLRMLLAGIDRMRAGVDHDQWLHLADSLVRHEVAEELVVYPVPGAFGTSGRYRSLPITHCRPGHDSPSTGLPRPRGFGTEAFAAASARFGLDVLAHIDREDAQVLPIVASRFGVRRRTDLGRRFREVENIAPLRRSLHGARMPVGPTIVDRTTALAVWIQDSAMAQGLAS